MTVGTVEDRDEGRANSTKHRWLVKSLAAIFMMF